MRESTDIDNSLLAKEVYDNAIKGLKEKKISDVIEIIQNQMDKKIKEGPDATKN